MTKREENIERFETLMNCVTRPGKEELVNYLKKTDFFVAPASTQFHLSCEGGLLQHSLNVYDCLIAKRENSVWKDILQDVPEESLIIVALFHDICKTNFYVEYMKNQKTYDPETVSAAENWQRKHDSQGDFVWETINAFRIDDQMPLGHGEKSAMIAQCYMRLTMKEAMAIRWHMGYAEEKSQYKSVGEAMEKYPLVLALHEADLEASKILKDVDGNK